MPSDNIDRAVKRGGGLSGETVNYDAIMYEGYAAGGVALLIECLTDNRNRAAADVRTAVTRNGGSMGDPGSVAFNFERKGVVAVSVEGGHPTEDEVLEATLDAGAEDVIDHGEIIEVRSDPGDLITVRSALRDAGIDYDSAEAEFVPNVLVPVDFDTAQKVIRVVDALEDSDDVQNVYTNMDVSADVQAQLDASEE